MKHQANAPELKKIRIVLVNTSHPGNIGAAARAMKNMGLSRLYLVSPKQFPSQEAFQRSAGAIDVLDNAVVVDDLKQALNDCVWVAGTSARLRTIQWDTYLPRECIKVAQGFISDGDIAIVFGRENSGLTNDEMACCNALLHIPTNPDYSSLNVASAVQVVSYELRLAMQEMIDVIETSPKAMQDKIASNVELDGMYQHLEQSLKQLGFFGKTNPENIMRRLRGLFNRASATTREVSIIRGICAAIKKK